MATAQLLRGQAKQGSWSGIFPQEQVTETQSTLFVKKLLAVAVSSVTYLRAIFPEHAFGDRCLEDINLKILRDDSACPGACQVIQWVKGCFDAIDKKYLKMILIGVYENPDDPDTVIEQYIFKFSYLNGKGIDIYRNKEKIASAQSAAETKKATIRLLRTIILLNQTLSPLPDDVMMTMKLLYDDEMTPPDYQPPGFVDCSKDTFEFEEEAMKLKIGDVSTPFHEVKLRISTTCHQLKYKDDDAVDDYQEDGITNQEEKGNESRGSPEVIEEVTLDQVAPQDEPDMADNQDVALEEEITRSPPLRKSENYNCNTRVSTPASTLGNNEDDVVTVCCPCDVNEDDGLMILCAVCNTWQHALCFGILNADEAPETHTCATCSENVEANDATVTDSSLLNLSAEERKEVCLWRRTLLAVGETARVLAPSLAKRIGVETNYASHLIKRLESEGFVKSNNKSKRLGKLVLKEKIETDGITKYFRKGLQEGDEAIDFENKSVDAIVSKASTLKLDGIPNDASCMDTQRNQRKGRKRAVSTVNADHVFEVNDSQELQQLDEGSRKRRKTSVASKSILV